MSNNLTHDTSVNYRMTTSVDFEVLAILQHLVGDEFPSVIWRYLSDSEGYIHKMDVAFKNTSFADLHEIAHTFKGSSGTLAANQLYQLCDELERACLNNPSHRVLAQLLNSVDAEFKNVKEGLLRYIEMSIESALP